MRLRWGTVDGQSLKSVELITSNGDWIDRIPQAADVALSCYPDRYDEEEDDILGQHPERSRGQEVIIKMELKARTTKTLRNNKICN